MTERFGGDCHAPAGLAMTVIFEGSQGQNHFAFCILHFAFHRMWFYGKNVVSRSAGGGGGLGRAGGAALGVVSGMRDGDLAKRGECM